MNKVLILFVIIAALSSCRDYTPKPKAFPKVDYPSRQYEQINVDCPFSFEIPTYAELVNYKDQNQPCWYNIHYPQFNATLHLSYLPIDGISGLDSLSEDAYQMVFKPHIKMADEIIEREISDSTKGLIGMIYDLEGKTATPLNFYISDSKNHFFRGSFYFNSKTNRDSILPIYKFINEDIMHSIQTFEFK